MTLLEQIWPTPTEIRVTSTFEAPCRVQFEGAFDPAWTEDFTSVTGIAAGGGYPIRFIEDDSLDTDAYTLTLEPESCVITGGDAGRFYAFQTLLQIVVFGRSSWQAMQIFDRPAVAKRGFMADMGRSVWTLPMLKNLVRILARLKMNQLHLHLYDDELCGIRFAGHNFGSDNPYALSVAELAELVDFAASSHVEIVPELEAWAHVGALVWHRPELRGGDGVYNGSSFLFCNETFELMRDLVGQIADVMPDGSTIHFGLDEANWFVAPELEPDFNPTEMVRRYHAMLEELGRERDKRFTMRLWADHAGRPLPPEIADKVVIEPWNYWQSQYEKSARDVGRYSAGVTPWMIGAGQSLGQYRAVYHATRRWCRIAAGAPRLLGVNLTFWGRNTLDEHIMMLYAGAGYIWNPFPNRNFDTIEDNEACDRILYPMLNNWQDAFPEARPDRIAKLRGPSVYCGFYWFNERHGESVSPSFRAANTANQHNFLKE